MITDILPFVPLVALAVTLAGLLISIRVAFTRKDLRNPKLKVRLGAEPPAEIRQDIPWRLRQRPLGILFFGLNAHKERQVELPLMIAVENKSRKSIKDIVVEIVLPTRFVITNEQFKESIEDSRQVLRDEEIFSEEFETNYPLADKLIGARDVVTTSGMAKVRYHVDVLRPGEGWSIFEPIRAGRRKSDAQENSGVASRAYEAIARHIRAIDGVEDHCVLTCTVLTENQPPRTQRLSVCIISTHQLEKIQKIGTEYVVAHWFGRLPKTGAYLSPFFAFDNLLGRIRGYELGLVCLLHEKQIAKKIMGDEMHIVSSLNPFDSEFQIFSLPMPPYDYYRLPDYVDTADKALHYMHATRIPMPRKIHARYCRRTANRGLRSFKDRIRAIRRKLFSYKPMG